MSGLDNSTSRSEIFIKLRDLIAQTIFVQRESSTVTNRIESQIAGCRLE